MRRQCHYKYMSKFLRKSIYDEISREPPYPRETVRCVENKNHVSIFFWRSNNLKVLLAETDQSNLLNVSAHSSSKNISLLSFSSDISFRIYPYASDYFA